MEDDPYGFCYRLEEDAAKAFSTAGLTAFVKQIRARFAAAATPTPRPGEHAGHSPDSARRRWAEILRTLYLRRKNVAAYQALAEETGLTPEDCHALATMLAGRRKAEEALSWVERGIALAKKASSGSMARYDLAALKRALLTSLGRGNEALDAAWAEYREHPSKYSYDDLMKYVPKTERGGWHEKAIAAAMGTDLHSLIELLLETKELERLAEIVRRSTDEALAGVTHFATEPAAKKLEKAHPDVAARLWCAQGMRIVNAKKSKYYEAALSTSSGPAAVSRRRGFTPTGSASWKRCGPITTARQDSCPGSMRSSRARARPRSRRSWSVRRRAGARGSDTEQGDGSGAFGIDAGGPSGRLARTNRALGSPVAQGESAAGVEGGLGGPQRFP
jgi:hypothetical protein